MGDGEHCCPQRTWKGRQEELEPVLRNSSKCTCAFIINTIRHHPRVSVNEPAGSKASFNKASLSLEGGDDSRSPQREGRQWWSLFQRLALPQGQSCTPGPQVATPPGSGADAAGVVTGSGLQVTPGTIPRYRAFPFHQDGREATALLFGRGEREQVRERGRMQLLDRRLCS